MFCAVFAYLFSLLTLHKILIWNCPHPILKPCSPWQHQFPFISPSFLFWFHNNNIKLCHKISDFAYPVFLAASVTEEIRWPIGVCCFYNYLYRLVAAAHLICLPGTAYHSNHLTLTHTHKLMLH